jgi:diaminobutyrate-2-oxoglutarate transaminase
MTNPTIEKLESNVRSYCRSFPTTFTTAHNAQLKDEDGESYIDFFGGAGALNYGHNNEHIQQKLIEYLQSGGVTHSLDMTTAAKTEFLKTFDRVLLQPREMDYKVMFPGPTGTNAVESALKLARKVTGRNNVVSFTNGFHGMTLGSLAVTGNAAKRGGAGVPLGHSQHVPFDGYFGDEYDTLAHIERQLTDNSSGLEKPAAFILETIQAEGGVNVASKEWLQGLQRIANEHDILLIVDDIQVGCGRTGPFFSFDEYGLDPDMITLSKSLSGYGLPFAVVLMKPEHDQFSPGEHNGTFRGFNPAMVTAQAALEKYWTNDEFSKEVTKKAAIVEERMRHFASISGGQWRGRGMIQGVEVASGDLANEVTEKAFEENLIIETAGQDGEVVKFLSPLSIEEDTLEEGLNRLETAFHNVFAQRNASMTAQPQRQPKVMQ